MKSIPQLKPTGENRKIFPRGSWGFQWKTRPLHWTPRICLVVSKPGGLRARNESGASGSSPNGSHGSVLNKLSEKRARPGSSLATRITCKPGHIWQHGSPRTCLSPHGRVQKRPDPKTGFLPPQTSDFIDFKNGQIQKLGFLPHQTAWMSNSQIFRCEPSRTGVCVCVC